MKKQNLLLVPFLIFQMVHSAWATDQSMTPGQISTPPEKSAGQSFSSDSLNLHGPLTIETQNSDLVGSSYVLKWTQPISEDVAYSLATEYGHSNVRLSGTIGLVLAPNQLVKFTLERLNQKLPFTFSSGEIIQKVHQNAAGIDYKYLIPHHTLQSIDVGGYVSHAPDVQLATLSYNSNSADCSGYGGTAYECLLARRIAGSTAEGGKLGLDFRFNRTFSMQTKVNYDHVRFHTIYEPSSEYNKKGFGGGLSLSKAIAPRIKWEANASHSALSDDAGGGFHFLIPFQHLAGLDTSLTATHQHAKTNTPSSTIYQFGINVIPGEHPEDFSYYTAASTSTQQDLLAWTREPAVHMTTVLAMAEEKHLLKSAQLASISPNTGIVTGGDTVQVTGSNFVPNSQVKFGQIFATTVNFESPNLLSVVTPEYSDSNVPVDITIINPSTGQQTVLPSAFTFFDAEQPTISSIAPLEGPIAGGTTVTLTGTNFDSPSVTFNGLTAEIISSTATSIVVHTPASSAGQASVVVTNRGGETATSSNYQYYGTPSITNLNPTEGVTSGGTSVAITGSNFSRSATVSFGSTSATSVTWNSSTSLTVTTPAGSAEAVDVTVTNPDEGQATASNAYTYYEALQPVISGVSPTEGPVAGGTTVTISGSNFNPTSVTFNGQSAEIVSSSSTSIVVQSPAGSSGQATIVVTNLGGDTASNTSFSYYAAPTLTSISPTSGTTAGGTSVTLTGTNFSHSATVLFGGTAASSVTWNSSTSLTATTPAGSAGAVDVTVTNPSQTPAVLGSAYTYTSTMEITSVSPNSAEYGGTYGLTFQGTNLSPCDANACYVDIIGIGSDYVHTLTYTAGTPDTLTQTSFEHTSDDYPAGTYTVKVCSTGSSPTCSNEIPFEIQAPNNQ